MKNKKLKDSTKITFRLTKENKIRFEKLHYILKQDNNNRTFNKILELFYEYETNKEALFHFKKLIEILKAN